MEGLQQAWQQHREAAARVHLTHTHTRRQQARTHPITRTPPHTHTHLCSSFRILCMRLYSFILNHSPTSFSCVLNHSRSLRAFSSARSVVS